MTHLMLLCGVVLLSIVNSAVLIWILLHWEDHNNVDAD